MCLVLRGKGGNKEVCDRGIQYQCLKNHGILELACFLWQIMLRASTEEKQYEKPSSIHDIYCRMMMTFYVRILPHVFSKLIRH